MNIFSREENRIFSISPFSYLKLLLQQLFYRLVGIVLQNFIHLHELRLVGDNHTGVGRNRNLTIGKSIERVDGNFR